MSRDILDTDRKWWPVRGGTGGGAGPLRRGCGAVGGPQRLGRSRGARETVYQRRVSGQTFMGDPLGELPIRADSGQPPIPGEPVVFALAFVTMCPLGAT